MRTHRIAITCLSLLLCAGSLPARAGSGDDPAGVIRALYAADQPWDQKNIDLGDRKILSRYFTPELVKQFMQLNVAAKRCKEDLCGFDFEPFYDTQDFDDHPDLKLRIELATPAKGQHYAVYFTVIKSEGEHRLEYSLVQTSAGWRIADILYPEAGDDHALTDMIKNLIKEAQVSK